MQDADHVLESAWNWVGNYIGVRTYFTILRCARSSDFHLLTRGAITVRGVAEDP